MMRKPTARVPRPPERRRLHGAREYTTTAKTTGPTGVMVRVDPEGHYWWFSERVRDPLGSRK
mgnify:CR=1 FL=1